MQTKYLLVKETSEGVKSLVLQSHDFAQVEKGMDWCNRVADSRKLSDNYFTAGWDYGVKNGLV